MYETHHHAMDIVTEVTVWWLHSTIHSAFQSLLPRK